MNKGLFQQIEPKHQQEYKQPPLESYRFVILDLGWGAERAAAKKVLSSLVQVGKVTPDESLKLNKLIEADDYEALQLAKGIMEQRDEDQ